jgi:hypothetical protein
MKRFAALLLALGILLTASTAAVAQLTDAMKNDGWGSIFDGRTLDGWKNNEREDGSKVANGCIVLTGERNHLYYMKEEFKNFELMIDCKINNNGNSGVYVKSQWQEANWPTTGFELQVNSTHTDPVKTGSLYEIVKILDAPHKDDEWFTYHIICRGNELECRINGKRLYVYVDQRAGRGPGGGQGGQGGGQAPAITPQNKRISQSGYIALQQHHQGSVVEFKNIFVKKLPD